MPIVASVAMLAGVTYTAAFTVAAASGLSRTSGAGVNAASAQVQAVLTASPASGDIHSIKHVVVIMQENRSFDHYFGTYPGADGIPVNANGVPTVCNPDPAKGICQAPYHDTADVNRGGPHAAGDVITDVNNGKMDGFVADAERGGYSNPDVMGYHTAAEIPNYWAYAEDYVLQDRMFESVPSWSLPSHVAMVSAWSAFCSDPGNVATCKTSLSNPDGDLGALNGPTAIDDVRDGDDDEPPATPPDYAWTDLTYLLHKNGVTWRYYTGDRTPEIWSPLPDFVTVHENGQLGNIVSVDQLYLDAAAGNLPAVSWVVPNPNVSDHPSAPVSTSQAYVTGLVNAIMRSPNWSNTAIFLSWDDWGGFYDHVQPPVLGGQSLGLRVPGLLISPYAKHGFIDHQTLSFDAYLKFIEDDFLNSQRLDPATDGRPDPRPDVRENDPGLGDLLNEFNFNQVPQAGLQLYPDPGGGAAQPLPVVDAPSVQAAGTAPFTVVFDGSASTVVNGTFGSWRLDFGDGSPVASASGKPPAGIRHQYPQEGTYTARLTVLEVSGASSAATQAVVVSPATPRASLTAYRDIGVTPLTVRFDGSLSSDPDGRLVSWSLNFGDGSPVASGAGPPPANLSHTYTGPGTFNATLSVRDPNSHASGPATVIINVGIPRVPSVTTGAVTLSGGQVHLTGTLNPNFDRTNFWFEYGPSTAYGSSTATSWTGYESLLLNVKQNIPVPAKGGTYHYRLAAKNGTGTSYGPDRTFQIGAGTAPIATTGSASAASASGPYAVTLSGTVTPNGSATTYRFDYGTTTSYGQSTASTSAGSGSAPVAVRAVIRGLTPKVTYHYRLVATSSRGTAAGTDSTFVIGPPVVSTGSAGSIGPTTVVVGGAVNPYLEATTFHVEYGTSTAYGLVTAEAPAGNGAAIVNVTAQLSALRPATTYHFRLVAKNPLGRAVGADETFRTAGGPAATTLSPSGVNRSTLQLNGIVTPNGQATTYWFEYGTSPTLGQATAHQAGGAGTAGVRVSMKVPFAPSARPYYARLVAANANGTAQGATLSFVFSAPAAVTGDAQAITAGAATVTGMVYPNLAATTAVMQYGKTRAYTNQTAPVVVAAVTGGVAVKFNLTGLTAWWTYHYRLVVTNTVGSSSGEDRIFTTARSPAQASDILFLGLLAVLPKPPRFVRT